MAAETCVSAVSSSGCRNQLRLVFRSDRRNEQPVPAGGAVAVFSAGLVGGLDPLFAFFAVKADAHGLAPRLVRVRAVDSAITSVVIPPAG